MLRAVIREVVGDAVTIVDSAATTARAARVLLSERGLLSLGDMARNALAPDASAISFLATDGVTRFATIGGRFLGQGIDLRAVELIDL